LLIVIKNEKISLQMCGVPCTYL